MAFHKFVLTESLNPVTSRLGRNYLLSHGWEDPHVDLTY